MTEPVRVHLRVPGTAPMSELMALLRDIEAAGFDGAGILDSQMLSRDTFVVLGQAAGHTSRMTLFPAVTNPFTRHASVLAGAIQTVEELAPGRVKFVIGTGYTSASTIGRKPATLAEMRASITAVKALLDGREVDWGGGSRTRLGFASKRPIPIIMAASGPKAIELAGEIADGALLLVGFNRGIVERALEHLDRGARRGGRRLEDLEIVWAVRTPAISGGGFIATGPDEAAVAKVVEWVRYRVAFYGSTPAYWPVLAVHGLEELGRKLNVMSKAGKWDEMAGEISDDVLRLFTAVATHEDLAREIERRFGGVSDSVGLSGGYGTRQDIPPDLVQDIRRIPSVFAGYRTSWSPSGVTSGRG